MTTTPQRKMPGLVDHLAPNSTSVRVMTLNLWGKYGAWTERRAVLIDGLRMLRPDLISFQESIKDDTYDQITDLLSSEYYVFHASDRTPNGSGGSFASRWVIDKMHEVDLHLMARGGQPVEWTSRAIAAEIRVPDPLGPLLIANYPTSWQYGFEQAREQQAVAAAQFVEEIVGQRNIHVVLAGDFNASPESASMRFWRGQQSLHNTSTCYTDAWENAHPGGLGHTFTAHNPLVAQGDFPLESGRRIDYILVRCTEYGPTLNVLTCTLAFNEAVNGVWGSDHFGVVADLVVPPKHSTGS